MVYRRLPTACRALVVVLVVTGITAAQQDPLLPPANGPRVETVARIVLKNGTVRTRPDADAATAHVVIDGGFVTAVVPPDAYDPTTEAGAVVYDLKGLTVYAGFVDPFVEIDVPAPKADRPGAHWNPRVTPDRDVLDGAGLDAKTAGDLRKIGVTSAGLSPRGGLVRGTSAVVSTAAAATDPAAPRPRVHYPQAYQTIGVRSGFSGFGGGRPSADSGPEGQWPGYPGSSMGAIALVRQTFYDAMFPASGASCLAPLRQDPPFWFDVPDELDLLRAAKIADEFALADRNAVVFVGGGNEFRRLAAVVDALTLPSLFLKGIVLPLEFPETPSVGLVGEQESVELRELMTWEQAPTNPRRLVRAGATVAFTSARLRDRSAFFDRIRTAIKHGLTEAEALAALTVAPAALLGLGSSHGEIGPGRVADLIVADGPLFDEKTKIRDVYTAGRRHEINRAPPRDLAGTWTLDIVESSAGGGVAPTGAETPTSAPVRRRLVIDKDRGIKALLDDRTADAKNVVVADDRLTFQLDHGPLGKPGIYSFSCVVESDVMSGVCRRADGSTFTFVARRDAAASGPASRPESRTASRPESGPDSRPESRAESRGDSRPESRPDSRPTADAPPPEALPLPFGPYGLDAPATRPAVVHVVGGTVWTSGPEGVIENGYVVIEDGVVKSVGRGKPAGRADLVIDATGKHVTPGIIDCHSHTGISGGVNEGGQAVTAEVRIEDVTDPDDIEWYRQLAAGVTTVNQLHGSANAIGGQNCVTKIRWGVVRPDDMHFAGAPSGIKFALGENPTQVNGSGRGARDPRYPQTRMGVEALIRDRLHAGADYAAARVRDPDGVRIDLELEAMAEIVRGERLVHCHSYRQDEILMLCKVADEFGFKIGTFQHVLEGYKIAEAIATHALGASSFADWWAYKIEVWDGIPHNGSLMRDQGVNVSFNSDSDEMARRMNIEAAKAVKYGGTPAAEALKFVTLNPAVQLGVADRTGSLEPGKDADFAIWSGPPLDTYSRCEETWIDGVRRFSLAEDAAHRAKIATERSRLIQKALTAGAEKSGGGSGRRGRGHAEAHADAQADAQTDAMRSGAGVVDDGPETPAMRSRRIDRIRALFERGDTRGMRPGDCGCEELLVGERR